jgi:hypothetical protein
MENNNNNNPLSAENANEQNASVGYWSTPEQVAEAVAKTEEVVEAPVAEPVVEAPVVETPAEVVEAPAAVVEAPAAEEPVQSLGFTKTGAIGSMAADGPKKATKPEVELADKVAIHSTKSVRWEEVGSISKGYNIVTKAQAEKWLTRNHVRIATPEEVQKAFG